MPDDPVASRSWSSLVKNIAILPGQEGIEHQAYNYLQGSDVGVTSPEIDAAMELLYPDIDGKTSKLSQESLPEDFNTAPGSLDPAKFLKWHSGYQLQYINEHIGTASSLAITGDGKTINVMLSADSKKVYVIENLDKTTIAKMSKAEQDRLASSIAFTNRLDNLQLTTDSTTATGLITLLENKINLGSNQMPQDDRAIFLAQLTNLRTQLANMTIFSLNDIKTQVDAISARFVRAEAFAGDWENQQQYFDGTGDDPPRYYYSSGVTSLDNGATIERGYALFMTQEKQLLALQNTRLEIAGLISTPAGQTPVPTNLDVPTLVYMLQLNYNLQGEAKVAIQTEEINQTNALLKTYAEMQRLVNDTIKEFDVKKQEESRAILGTDGNKGPGNVGSANVFENNPVLAMFEKNGLTQRLHPIEELKSVTRVTQQISDNFSNNTLKEWTKSTWDTFSSQLADRVTLINQESQIKMNEVNSLDKQKNRHFDLANNALSKMSEILQNIARTTS